MTELDKLLFEINEAARIRSQTSSLVYLRERGVVVDLDTCTDAQLLAAARDQLTKDRAELGCILDRIGAIERQGMEGADDDK